VDYDVTYDIDGRPVGDKELFAIMRGAMKVLSFTEDDESNIFKIMAIVLHLGNIEFGGKMVTSLSSYGEATKNGDS
jgi:myosin heavy subunit